ncbi:hypothetical protein NMA510612_0828 [Neisseria meningitidis]|uniref:Uncharacterized protein n=1 Tax=Neisseria meningitidis TaxID=487 RepID=X5EHG5_NEIME|nr:hypothetical protein NMA510612_0828 [Neisseria meningitidis]
MLIHYIDIAKRNFVIAVSSLSKTKTETNNPKGIAHTIEYLKKHKVETFAKFPKSPKFPPSHLGDFP